MAYREPTEADTYRKTETEAYLKPTSGYDHACCIKDAHTAKSLKGVRPPTSSHHYLHPWILTGAATNPRERRRVRLPGAEEHNAISVPSAPTCSLISGGQPDQGPRLATICHGASRTRASVHLKQLGEHRSIPRSRSIG